MVSITATPTSETSVNRNTELGAKRKLDQLKRTETQLEQHISTHKAVAPQFVTPPAFVYSLPVDGQQFKVSGDASFDLSPIQSSPIKTLAKANLLHKAVMAPSAPTSSDLSAAQKTLLMAVEAKFEIRTSIKTELGGLIDTYV